jgi:predicted RNA-binding Zn-ribbon protein involved in translation (DUF1610 family)
LIIIIQDEAIKITLAVYAGDIVVGIMIVCPVCGNFSKYRSSREPIEFLQRECPICGAKLLKCQMVEEG